MLLMLSSFVNNNFYQSPHTNFKAQIIIYARRKQAKSSEWAIRPSRELSNNSITYYSHGPPWLITGITTYIFARLGPVSDLDFNNILSISFGAIAIFANPCRLIIMCCTKRLLLAILQPRYDRFHWNVFGIIHSFWIVIAVKLFLLRCTSYFLLKN